MKSTIVYFFQNPHTEAEGANIKKTKPKGKGHQEKKKKKLYQEYWTKGLLKPGPR